MTFRIYTTIAIIILALVFAAIVTGILTPVWFYGTLTCVGFGMIFIGRIKGAQ